MKTKDMSNKESIKEFYDLYTQAGSESMDLQGFEMSYVPNGVTDKDNVLSYQGETRIAIFKPGGIVYIEENVEELLILFAALYRFKFKPDLQNCLDFLEEARKEDVKKFKEGYDPKSEI